MLTQYLHHHTQFYVGARFNSRVLGYATTPAANGAVAAFVIGQAGMDTNGSGLTSSTNYGGAAGVEIYGDKLLVSTDGTSHIMVYNIP